MNKLEKQKLEEIAEQIYRLNSFISLYYIGLKHIPNNNELLEVNDILARTIRQLRELSR